MKKIKWLNARSDTRARRSIKVWKSRARRFILGACLALFVLWAGAVGWASGSFTRASDWATESFDQASASLGFTVDEVLVQGRHHTDAALLLEKIDIAEGAPIFSVDLLQARAAIEEIPWVSSARVSRRLPNRVYVELTEREPAALWQYKKQLSVIDADGVVLTGHNLDKYRDLPLLVGEDAPLHVKAMVTLLRAEPEIAHRLEAAMRVGGRRWDLRLKNGMHVKLPEQNVELALRRLMAAQEKGGLFDRGVSVVDLRLPEKLVVDLNETI